MRFLGPALTVVAISRLAFADAPPEPPRKDIPYSVVVDNIAEITQFAIVLYPWHERAGAAWTLGVFTPGQELAIDPEAPEPQIFRIKATDLPSLRVEVAKAKSLDAARMAVKMKGTECGDTLPRHQQVLKTLPVTAMRKHVSVDTHLLCERISVKEELIGPDAGGTAPAASNTPASGSSSPAPSSSSPAAPSASVSKGCGSCQAGGAGGSGASILALTGLAALRLRRRRRS